MKKKAPRLITSEIAFDWKEYPTCEDLNYALNKFGVHVAEHSWCEGSDTVVYVFSNRPLTAEELRELAEDDERDVDLS